jgi:hypothetical protein
MSTGAFGKHASWRRVSAGIGGTHGPRGAVGRLRRPHTHDGELNSFATARLSRMDWRDFEPSQRP